MDRNLKLIQNDFQDIFELLAENDNSVIFKIDSFEDQINQKILVLYSSFENIGLYDIFTLNDILKFIDIKSEIPEVFGLEKYLNILHDEINGNKHSTRIYLPLKINSSTFVYSLKIVRNKENKKSYFYLNKVDITLFDLEKLYQDSYKDKLTNLFNRNALRLHIQDNVDQHYFGFFDLDGFKEINDTFGHTEGDKLLKLIGDKLIEISDNTVVFYRYGGDEFIFMSIGLTKEETDKLVLKIRHNLNQIEFKGQTVKLSLGYVNYLPTEDISELDAIMLADLGMYYSKANGKNIDTYIDEIWKKQILENGLSEEIDKYRKLAKRY